MRLMEQQFEFLLPGFLVTDRFPIGTEEVISSAPRQRFVDFYSGYYRPGNITLCVSGDIDPDEIVARIQGAFDTLAPPSTPGADPDLGEVDDFADSAPPSDVREPLLDDRSILLQLWFRRKVRYL